VEEITKKGRWKRGRGGGIGGGERE